MSTTHRSEDVAGCTTPVDAARAPGQQLRYVNPYKRRGWLYLAACRVSATSLGAWLSVNFAWKIDPISTSTHEGSV